MSDGDGDNTPDEAQLMGQALANLRKKAGISQPKAAEAAGLGSYQAWQGWENGAAGIFKPDNQRRLTRALGLTRDDLVAEFQRLLSRGALDVQETPGHFFRPHEVPVFGATPSSGRQDSAAVTAIRSAPLDLDWLFDPRTRFLRVGDDTMSGYVEPGMVVAFDLDLWPRLGDGAVVELTNGDRFVTEYRGRSSLRLLGRQRVPDQEVSWELMTVRKVYKIRARFD